MFVVLDQTFDAFADVSRPYIQETIEKSPPTLETVNAGLPKIDPFLHDTARFFTALRPGAKALQETSPIIAESLQAGIPALNASPVLNNQLLPTARGAARLPAVGRGLHRAGTAHRPEQEPQGTARIHRPGADQVLLRKLAVQQPLRVQQRGERLRQVAQRDLVRAAGRTELRGGPGGRAGKRTGDEPPSLQPASAYRGARARKTSAKRATRNTYRARRDRRNPELLGTETIEKATPSEEGEEGPVEQE